MMRGYPTDQYKPAMYLATKHGTCPAEEPYLETPPEGTTVLVDIDDSGGVAVRRYQYPTNRKQQETGLDERQKDARAWPKAWQGISTATCDVLLDPHKFPEGGEAARVARQIARLDTLSHVMFWGVENTRGAENAGDDFAGAYGAVFLR